MGRVEMQGLALSFLLFFSVFKRADLLSLSLRSTPAHTHTQKHVSHVHAGRGGEAGVHAQGEKGRKGKRGGGEMGERRLAGSLSRRGGSVLFCARLGGAKPPFPATPLRRVSHGTGLRYWRGTAAPWRGPEGRGDALRTIRGANPICSAPLNPHLSSPLSQKYVGETPTHSAHPARFSPDDKFSRERVETKRRFGLLPTQQPAPVL